MFKIVLNSIVATFFTIVLTSPVLFYVSLSSWADPCTRSSEVSCSSGLFFQTIIYNLLFATIVFLIGNSATKRWFKYSQNYKVFAFIIASLVLVEVIFDVFTSAGGGMTTILVWLSYTVFSAVEYSYLRNKSKS